MLWKVVGYIRLKFCGDNIYGFINECKKNSIELKNVRKLAGNYYGDVLSSNLKRVVKYGKECGVTVKVEGRFGIAMKIFIYRNRIAFMTASLLFCIIFALNSLFIKKIYITGNYHLTDNQIQAVISQCGIYRGKFILSVKPDVIKEEILKKCEHLSWVWVDIKGTSAYVDVREKISKPQIFDPDYACNIVAERDGVIKEAVAESGILYAKEGSFVKKGELLIGGVYDSNEYAPVRFVHSKGKIYAQTSYYIEDTFNLYLAKYKSGKRKKNVFGISAGLGSTKFGTSADYMSLIEENKKEFSIFGKNYFSLGFTNSKYCEIIKEEYKMGYNEASKMAINNLTMRLKSTLPSDAEIIDVKSEARENPDGTFVANVTIECLEDIGTELQIGLSQ